MAYFVYLLLLDGLTFTYFMAICVCPSGDLFCTHTSYWWPILYTGKFLNDSLVHILTSPCLTYSPKVSHVHDLDWTLLNFMTYFVYLLLLGELIFTYFIAKCVCSSCDLFCTRNFSFWFIVYTKKFFDRLFSTIVQSILYIYFSLSLAFIWVTFYGLHDLFCTNTSSWWPTHVDLFSINTTFSDLVCTLVSFLANIVYLLLLDVLIFTYNVFYGYICTYHWCNILYI